MEPRILTFGPQLRSRETKGDVCLPFRLKF